MCYSGEPSDGPCDRVSGIGHAGWTGTSLWIDPDSGVWTVLLTNRTYEPRAPNRLQEVRRELYARARGARPAASDPAVPDSAGP
jgi:CubicO group peptidase (beta-lactamase class C family)